ncbi:hypothetical protein KKF55_00430 [Patescibacteria group bacterium]|nr:hypothetical protein [Patescibacteria group bacterium]
MRKLFINSGLVVDSSKRGNRGNLRNQGNLGNRRKQPNILIFHYSNIISLFIFFSFIFVISAAEASTTAPQKLVYNGHLLDSSGTAITTSHSVRFSFWTSADYVSTDVTSTGALHTAATTYASWNETFTVTPNSSGYFNVELGSGTSLPDFSAMSTSTLNNLHLQVEVKAASDADTSYELLDRDTSNPSLDRAPLLSVPFALNADLLDGHDTGTASGSIPVLLTGGLLPVSTIPGGTNQDTFTLDNDNSVSSGNIGLTFGQNLGKVLEYDVTNSTFSFNDAVRVGGTLTATGGLTASGTIATESGVVINVENEAKDSVLVFGNPLGQETLKFLNNEHVFEFSDDLRTTGDLSASGVLAVESDATVGGNLTVEGLINGIDINSLVSSEDDYHLKVSSGGGLTIDVAGGSYRLGGNVTNYAGTTGEPVSDDTTNYVYINTGGLVINQTGFPTDHMYIQLSTVLTAGGDISTVTDRRIFNSSDTERTVTKVFRPEFEGASYLGDGSSNVGQLSVSHSGGNLMNYYKWTSTRSSLNDYDVLLRVTLPPDFVRWGSTPLSVSYKSSSSNAADNKMDIAVFDSSGSTVTLSGTSTGLANTGWTTTTHTFSGSPTWTAGSESLVRLRMYAKDDEEMHLGTVKLTYVELLSE